MKSFHWTINGKLACDTQSEKHSVLSQKNIYLICSSNSKTEIESWIGIWNEHFPEDKCELVEGDCPNYGNYID